MEPTLHSRGRPQRRRDSPVLPSVPPRGNPDPDPVGRDSAPGPSPGGVPRPIGRALPSEQRLAMKATGDPRTSAHMNNTTLGLRARGPLGPSHTGGPGRRPRRFPWGWTSAVALLVTLGASPGAASGVAPNFRAPEPGALTRSAAAAPPPISRLEGWVHAPDELVRAAAGGRPPGFGAAVTLVPSADRRARLLVGAPAGLSVASGGLVLGAARTGAPETWVTDRADSWWSGPRGFRPTSGTSSGVEPDDEHGRAVQAAPGWAALGAPSASPALALEGAPARGLRAGAVTLLSLEHAAGAAPIVQWLQPPPGEAAGGFGSALAFLVEGGVTRALAVGSPFAADPATGLPMVGAVHVFEPQPVSGGAATATWRQVRTLRPAAPGVGMSFGASLAWCDGALVIGAPGDGALAPGAGSVHGMSGTGEPRWVLRSNEPGARLGSTLCPLDMAWGVGESGLAVSAPGRGRVQVYDLVAGVPEGVAELLGRSGAGFGLALAAAGPHLLVGAPFAGSRGVPLAGVVHRFTAGQGVEAVETLGATPPTIGGEFGVSVAALRGRDGVLRLAVGEPGSHEGCSSSGASCRPGRVGVFVLP